MASETVLELLSDDDEVDVPKTTTTLGHLTQTLESVGLLYADLIQRSVTIGERSPLWANRFWETLCAAGWRGQAEQVHALRGEFLNRFNHRLELIRQTRDAIANAPRSVSALLPEADHWMGALWKAEGELETFARQVFSRWQTLEDLEDLLAETYPASNAQFEEVRKKLPPFHEQWYAENSKPF